MSTEELKARPSTKKVGRWKDKVYSKQLMEYVNQSIRADEIGVYNTFFNSIADKNNMSEPHELMMLDIACYDFIRIKRIQKIIMKEGDVTVIRTRSGQMITKSHEAGYLLNAVETQFRHNMKELLLTRKEDTKKKLGLASTDFSNWLNMKTVGVKEDERSKDARGNGE
tara:strand:+ start:66 stop:569 length:504 start_codon:yes stop_codon:yes gene_type:complete